eukprot:TRINITY_DN2769_c0_g1_i1.p1 TRINITY_DN2769_c0_g1~~TRINITY_DN2769_c0_g1_i1.p1  ORF type:complete len:565 (+),score=209.87 TRINITY_DN2769_c0_g1_i1:71-1765(+)
MMPSAHEFSQPTISNEFVYQLQRDLEEKTRDAELAAELGQTLLKENRRLAEELSHLNHENDSLQDQLSAIIGSPSQRSEDQQLQSRVKDLEFENKKLKDKNTEWSSRCEEAERQRYDILEDFDEMKRQVDSFRGTIQEDQEENKTLRELVETQKEAIEELSQDNERYKKTISKLKEEEMALSKQISMATSAQSTMESLQTQIKNLSRENALFKKTQDENFQLQEENSELRSLLKDKEQLSEAVQYLLEENKSYRRSQEELTTLLDDAKKTATELKDRLEESLFERMNFSEENDEEKKKNFDYFRANEKEIVQLIEKLKVERGEQDWAESLRQSTARSKTQKPLVLDEKKLTDSLRAFSKKSGTFTSRTLERAYGQVTDMEEKKFLLQSLQNKLESAEGRLKEMNGVLEETKTREEVLESLNTKLVSAEEKIRGKEAELKKLREQLQNQANPNSGAISGPMNAKEGWLTKRGNYIPTWKRRYCAISAIDNKFYYAKSPTDRFLGVISLKFAYIQQDTNKRMGKENCFIINTADDKRTYYIYCDTKKDMDEWMNCIQDRIDSLSFA